MQNGSTTQQSPWPFDDPATPAHTDVAWPTIEYDVPLPSYQQTTPAPLAPFTHAPVLAPPPGMQQPVAHQPQFIGGGAAAHQSPMPHQHAVSAGHYAPGSMQAPPMVSHVPPSIPPQVRPVAAEVAGLGFAYPVAGVAPAPLSAQPLQAPAPAPGREWRVRWVNILALMALAAVAGGVLAFAVNYDAVMKPVTDRSKGRSSNAGSSKNASVNGGGAATPDGPIGAAEQPAPAQLSKEAADAALQRAQGLVAVGKIGPAQRVLEATAAQPGADAFPELGKLLASVQGRIKRADAAVRSARAQIVAGDLTAAKTQLAQAERLHPGRSDVQRLKATIKQREESAKSDGPEPGRTGGSAAGGGGTSDPHAGHSGGTQPAPGTTGGSGSRPPAAPPSSGGGRPSGAPPSAPGVPAPGGGGAAPAPNAGGTASPTGGGPTGTPAVTCVPAARHNGEAHC